MQDGAVKIRIAHRKPEERMELVAQQVQRIVGRHGGHFRLPAVVDFLEEVADCRLPQLALVLEVIGHQREVQPGPFADRADAGGVITLVSKFAQRRDKNGISRFNAALLFSAQRRSPAGGRFGARPPGSGTGLVGRPGRAGWIYCSIGHGFP